MSLIGIWAVDVTDTQAFADLGDVLLDFKEDGRLIYTIRADAKHQIMNLRYSIEGSTIVTDQPSMPKVERTKFLLSEGGVLSLEFGGVYYRFRRQQPRDE
jgi:hypothetical protein